LHVAFKTPYLHDFVRKLRRQWAKMFATLGTVSTQGSKLVPVRHTTDQMSINCCGYVLRQYTNIRHNVLHKMWADRAGVYIDTLYLKCKEEEEHE